jgi:hypothetical protein
VMRLAATTATPACAATRRAPLSQALCLATATQQPTTSRHRRQVVHSCRPRRTAEGQAPERCGGAGRVPPRDGTSDSPRGESLSCDCDCGAAGASLARPSSRACGRCWSLLVLEGQSSVAVECPAEHRRVAQVARHLGHFPLARPAVAARRRHAHPCIHPSIRRVAHDPSRVARVRLHVRRVVARHCTDATAERHLSLPPATAPQQLPPPHPPHNLVPWLQSNPETAAFPRQPSCALVRRRSYVVAN